MTSKTAVVSEHSVATFLAGHRIALIGASDDPKSFSSVVLHELVDHGYDVVPVNPGRTEVAGRACYAEVGFVPGVLDGAMVMVPPISAAAAVTSCLEAGIDAIWLFRGAGSQGSATREASDRCREAGVTVVNGACPLMFLEPTGWFHHVHRAIRRVRGDVVADHRRES
jgi:predicted CoA-binding protein